jgi:ABC-type multidrug transport system ATPase subunit
MMIEARGLGKRYGATAAVDDLTFTIRPGMVTGFLGPNGAGKTTTMRLILGLDHPSAGSVTVNGGSYAQLSAPMHQVGALLDAGAICGVYSPLSTRRLSPAPSPTRRPHPRRLQDPGRHASPTRDG